MWEKLLTRAPHGADRAFVNEGVLKQCAAAGSRQPRQYHRKSAIGAMTAAEHAYCSEQFIAYVAKRAGPHGYPRGAGLCWESSGWVGRLYANETDRNPSTIIFEDSTRLHVQGGKEPNRDIRLGIPLRFLDPAMAGRICPSERAASIVSSTGIDQIRSTTGRTKARGSGLLACGFFPGSGPTEA